MTGTRWHISRWLSTVAAFAASSSVLAQTPPADKAAAVDDRSSDIIVTAQKREQRLFDVSMSISAVDANEIAARGASAIEDMQSSVPSLTITQYSPGQQRATLRGVSNYSGLPTVGVYLDEIPLNVEIAQNGQDVRLIDLQRIEVLRGPQGTLYGQGAMGGTIRYITNDPDLKDITGSAFGEVAGVHHGGTDWQANGVINLPVMADRLALRLAGGYQKFGGWVDNTTLNIKDVNAGDTYTVRAKLLWQATEALRITGLYSHQDLDVGANSASDRNYRITEPVRSAFGSRADLANLTANYDFGDVSLLSATSYIDRSDHVTNDISALYIPILEAGLELPSGLLQTFSLSGDIKHRIFNQELRLASNGDGPIQWTFGGVYRHSRTHSVSATSLEPNIIPFTLIESDTEIKSRSWAVFGEVSYSLGPSIEATLGGRYFSDRRTFFSDASAFGVVSVDVGEKTFHSFSPRVNLLWRATDELNLYVNIAKGFRSGGFNSTSAGQGVVVVPPSYAPETLWSYEAGAKFQSADRRFDVDVSAYRNEWQDVQSVSLAPGSLINFTSNGGKLAGWGIDAQASFRPVAGLTLTGTASWNNMKYRSTTADHLPGDPADYVPEFTASASAEYRFSWTSSLPGLVRVDYQHADGYQIFIRNGMVAPAFSDQNDQLGARIGIETDRWSLGVFGRNLLNDRAIVAPAFGALLVPIRTEPRTIGLSGSINF